MCVQGRKTLRIILIYGDAWKVQGCHRVGLTSMLPLIHEMSFKVIFIFFIWPSYYEINLIVQFCEATYKMLSILGFGLSTSCPWPQYCVFWLLVIPFVKLDFLFLLTRVPMEECVDKIPLMSLKQSINRGMHGWWTKIQCCKLSDIVTYLYILAIQSPCAIFSEVSAVDESSLFFSATFIFWYWSCTNASCWNS